MRQYPIANDKINSEIQNKEMLFHFNIKVISAAKPNHPPPLTKLTWNQMLFIGLLIQKIGRTQNPVKVYDKMTPSQGRMPDSEGLLIIPVVTSLLEMVINGTVNHAATSHHTSTGPGTG